MNQYKHICQVDGEQVTLSREQFFFQAGQRACFEGEQKGHLVTSHSLEEAVMDEIIKIRSIGDETLFQWLKEQAQELSAGLNEFKNAHDFNECDPLSYNEPTEKLNYLWKKLLEALWA